MDAIELLLTRQSDGQLSFPGPSDEQLEVIKNAALRVPDHGGLAPWQFIVARDEGRDRLGEIYHLAAERENMDERSRERARQLPQRAPMVITVVAKCKDHPKVPKVEQIASAACAVLAMQQAAFALGLGGVWRTGAFAYSPTVKAALGLDEEDDIVGFLYLGSKIVDCPKKRRHQPDSFFIDL